MPQVIISFCALLTITSLSTAQDIKPKPNTLTPKEIVDGWILLFDGTTTFGWMGEKWKTENGELVSPGKKLSLRSTCEFVDFELEFECISERQREAILGFGKYSERDSHPVRINLSGNHSTNWQRVHLTVEGRHAAGIIHPIATKKDPVFPEAVMRERAGIPVPLVFTGDSLRIRSLKLRPLNTKSLFNGKDLTGWREFSGKKSKFAVTDKSEINVQDGPGDLQTTGKYKNFLLQLECISHGKHLNSGIFFRCRDNEYQNGYEAQIRNQFTPTATQKYVIEDYDPMTNKLLGKKEIMSTAVDYGTGAIYRRQPARKEMAKDGEWFAMTIVADGNHLATWVNGVQVTDWYDNRPRSDNARTACKLDAGHISIQGHDPTTNLSFRNLRIAELPEIK